MIDPYHNSSSSYAKGGPSGPPFRRLRFDTNQLTEHTVDQLVDIYGEDEMQDFFESITAQETMDPQALFANLVLTLIFDRHFCVAYSVVREAVCITIKEN